MPFYRILTDREQIFQMFSPFCAFFILIIMKLHFTFDSSYWGGVGSIFVKSSKSLLENVVISGFLQGVIFESSSQSTFFLQTFVLFGKFSKLHFIFPFERELILSQTLTWIFL